MPEKNSAISVRMSENIG